MKTFLILSLVILSTNVYSQSTKAKKAVIPESAQKNLAAKTPEAPCAKSKEDVLKKLEEKKKAQEAAGKGFALQGAKDTGCSVK